MLPLYYQANTLAGFGFGFGEDATSVQVPYEGRREESDLVVLFLDTQRQETPVVAVSSAYFLAHWPQYPNVPDSYRQFLGAHWAFPAQAGEMPSVAMEVRRVFMRRLPDGSFRFLYGDPHSLPWIGLGGTPFDLHRAPVDIDFQGYRPDRVQEDLLLQTEEQQRGRQLSPWLGKGRLNPPPIQTKPPMYTDAYIASLQPPPMDYTPAPPYVHHLIKGRLRVWGPEDCACATPYLCMCGVGR